MIAPQRSLVVLCPHWPATATGRDPLEPVAVVRAGRVDAASAAARRCGVQLGQRRREAESCCPDLVVVPRDHGGELRAFEPVVLALEAFGAPVALAEPGWAAIATRGPARYFGGEKALAHGVAERVALALPAEPGAPLPRGLVGPFSRVGIADGPFAATLAAEQGRIVARGATASFLAPFPVEVLSRPRLAEVLLRLGISTLGAFAALPEPDVLARFGADGVVALRLARGADDGRLRPRPRARELAVEATLDPPIERVDAAFFAARSLAGALCEQLAGAGLVCTLLEVEVMTAAGVHLSRRWARDGGWSPPLIAERLRWQLDAWLAGEVLEDGAGISALRLAPVELSADQGRQLELFGRPTAGEERVARLLARVQGMLGTDAVLVPVFVGGRGPAERVRLVPAGDPLAAQGRSGGLPWPGQLPSPSPAVLPSPPIAADLRDAAGRLIAVDARGALSAPPATLSVAGAPPSRVTAWTGPWPVDERWWARGSRRRRARLQVLVGGEVAYLLALEQRRWVVEGIYD